jgi:dTDP-glucose 4,6-dehydratase
MILVTGGAGFIGSNFILRWLASHNEPVLCLDKLTYSGEFLRAGETSMKTREPNA